MDTSLFFLINKGLQNSFFDMIMPLITKRAYMLLVLIVIPVFSKERKKGLQVLGLCLLSFAIADSSANILKHLFERPRPCHILEDVRLLVGCGRSFSFPSSHAVNAFAVAATFSHFYRKAALPMFFCAALIAFSRIYVGVHYPSDVIAGAIWGGIITALVILIHKWFSKRFSPDNS
jgi:undecaprenyl-diphosphatase